MHNIKVGVIQMSVTNDKDANLKKAHSMIKQACQQGVQLVVLPEVFNSPYQTELFPDYAEPYPGPTTRLLSALAAEHEVLLVGGSIIEKNVDGQLYNSSFVFDEKGQLLGRHRKIHLFDINLTDKITFKESNTLNSGDSITIIRHQGLCLGVMICYDFRFPELARAYVIEGAKLLVIPAAFPITTGEAHWDLLMRSRAVDNQCFVIAAAPARNPESSFQAWGHSMVVDPWGQIIAQAEEEEGIIYAELDFEQLEQIRQQLPLLQHRRHDLYQLIYGRLME